MAAVVAPAKVSTDPPAPKPPQTAKSSRRRRETAKERRERRERADMRTFRRLIDAAAKAATHHSCHSRLVTVLRAYVTNRGRGDATNGNIPAAPAETAGAKQGHGSEHESDTNKEQEDQSEEHDDEPEAVCTDEEETGTEESDDIELRMQDLGRETEKLAANIVQLESALFDIVLDDKINVAKGILQQLASHQSELDTKMKELCRLEEEAAKEEEEEEGSEVTAKTSDASTEKAELPDIQDKPDAELGQPQAESQAARNEYFMHWARAGETANRRNGGANG